MPQKRKRPQKRTGEQANVGQKIPRTSKPRSRSTSPLPVELLLEVVSHLPVVTVPASRIYYYVNPSLPAEYFVRSNTLRALSQTSRILRDVFLPLFWERLDAFGTHRQYLQFARKPANILEKKTKGMSENRDIASYVRFATIALVACGSTKSLDLLDLVRLLELLPNLHTLHITHFARMPASYMETVFEGHIFPSLQTLIIPACICPLLSCCPEVRVVTLTEGGGASYEGYAIELLAYIEKGCKNIEVLRGIEPDTRVVESIVRAAPALRSISFVDRAAPSLIRLLSPLKQLRSIQLRAMGSSADTTFIDSSIEAAKHVLLTSSAKDKKVLVSRHRLNKAGLDPTLEHWIEDIEVL